MGIKNFIDRLLNNHFEIIKSEVVECDYPIDYYYFSDKYGHFSSTTGRNGNYDIFIKEELWPARATAKNKAINIEH